MSVQARTVLAQRKATGALLPVMRLDVVSLRAARVVVVLRSARLGRVERIRFGHAAPFRVSQRESLGRARRAIRDLRSASTAEYA
jgi:hypothetical protein